MADADYNRHIQEYVHAVQGALAALSVADSDVVLQGGDESSFLVFELLDWSGFTNERRVFRPYVSDRVIDTVERGNRVGRKKAQQDLSAYQECEISTQWRASGLMYQAWKQGLLRPIYFPQADGAGNGLSEANQILAGLFLMSCDETSSSGCAPSDEFLTEVIAKALGLGQQFGKKCFADGSQWFLADSPDAIIGKLEWKEFNAIEFDLVHRVNPNELKNFCLIHYPLVIDGYWFVGFAYLLKNLDDPKFAPGAELFLPGKYAKCLAILHKAVASPLKLALRERAFSGIEWRGSRDKILLEVARRHFVCFDVKPQPINDCPEHLVCLHQDGISIYSPRQIFGDHKQIEEARQHIKSEVMRIQEQIEQRIQPYLSGRRSAVAAISSASLSHNIGSHALSDARLFDPADRDHCEALREFHRYLQSRMDYLAQLIAESAPHPEPQYLFGDVLSEFFRQRLLIDRLVADHGFDGAHIEFVIDLSAVGHENKIRLVWSGKGFKSTDPERAGQLLTVPPSLKPDVLVAVPGGTLGCHALYTILENMMRNSVKYGKVSANKTDERKLVVCIRLRNPGDGKDYWLLELSDNLSGFSTQNVADMGAYANMAGDFNDYAIAADASAKSGGHGLMEIKEAMRFLHPHHDEVDGPRACPSCKETQDACCILSMANVREKPDGNSGKLVFRVRLRRPSLLAVWRPGASDRMLADCQSLREGIFIRRHLTDTKGAMPSIIGLAPYSLVILDPGDGDVRGYVDEVALQHWHLPFRLMVFCGNATRMVDWANAIKSREMATPEAGKPQDKAAEGRILPRNRIRVILDEPIWKQLAGLLAPDDLGGLAFVNTIYDRWLAAYKPAALAAGDKWHLNVDIERGEEIATRWICADKLECDSIEVGVYHKVLSGQMVHCVGENLGATAFRPEHVIHFGNHDASTPELRSAIDGGKLAANFRFGSVEAPRTFAALYCPPVDQQSFTFFVLALVEAALTKIAVFDERSLGVFSNDIVKGELSKERLMMAKSANVLPLVGIPSDAGYKGAWVPAADFISHIGVDLTRPTTAFLLPNLNGAEIIQMDPNDIADVLLLHEGLIEGLISNDRFPEGGETRFCSAFSRVVRMSGKGPQARKVDKHLPFCAYSAVSSCLLPYFKDGQGIRIEKLNLARAVLNCFPGDAG